MNAFLVKSGMMPTISYAGPYVETVVKLLYANITLKFGNKESTQYGKAFVRNKVYSVTPEIINSHLGIERVPQGEEQVSDIAKVGSHLTGERVSEWTPEMKVSSLTAMHNVLHKLTTTNWLPTTNNTIVTKDQAVLLYKLTSGIKVDVGKMIFDRIWQEAESTKETNLPYPSLIYQILLTQNFIPAHDDYPTKLPSTFKITSNHTKGDRVIDLPWVDPQQPASNDNVGESPGENVATISVPHNFLLRELDRCNAQIQFFTEQLQRAHQHKASINILLSYQKKGQPSGTTGEDGVGSVDSEDEEIADLDRFATDDEGDGNGEDEGGEESEETE